MLAINQKKKKKALIIAMHTLKGLVADCHLKSSNLRLFDKFSQRT